MDSLTCKVCHNRSSITSSARRIRCHGCQRTISTGNTEPAGFSSLGSNKCQTIISSSNDKLASLNSFARNRCLPLYRKSSRGVDGRISSSIRTFQSPAKGKRALLCGVSYKNSKYKLKGTSQDVINMQHLLAQKFGFPDDAFLILGEDEQHQKPTRSNILDGFKWLVANQERNDSLVFYFSGHGLRQLNVDEDEVDGFDEAICPVDFETAGMIVDNEINKLIVAPLKEGVTLHAIVDTCHSGTLLDLSYVYNKNKGLWDPPSRVSKGTSGGQAICISACEDYQLASDTSTFSKDRTMAGAMTHTLIKSISGKQEITYRNLLDSMHKGIQEANKSISRGIRRLFQSQMMQDPILSASKPFNIDAVFTL